jgi:glycosyltransferase involved in cell wall biosynthesis
MKRRVLYVSHNHPSIVPGGAETYALELYRGMQASSAFEPYLLSRIGNPHVGPESLHAGTLVSAVNGDPRQYFFHTDTGDFDWLMLSPYHKEGCSRFFGEFLDAHRPDVVHFQHTLFLGFDIITTTRRVLPHAPIVYTLHEYVPICHRDGQMIRARDDEPCLEASPRRCHTCFPSISPQRFFVRKQFISAHLSHVDAFIAPSRFLRDRFVDWGLPADKVHVEEYGRLPMPGRVETPDRPRNRFGFFGQLNPSKGIAVLLEAMQLMAESDPARDDAKAHLWVHGANLEFQAEAFQRRFHDLLDATRSNVTFAGRYDQSRVPALMSRIDWVVVPSIWWENSPLVIQEAFAHGRPVICSDMGAMLEKVTHGVNGLHFRANDASSLAQTLRTAAGTPGLWETLRAGVPPVYSMADHVARMELLYRDLLEKRAA